jgi:hypothetical protein
LQALDPTQPVTVSFSVEQVNNAGGVYEVRTVHWTRQFKFYSCDVDATTVSRNGVSVTLVNATEALTGQTSGVPWVQYVDPTDVLPPPPPPPQDLISYGTVQIGPDGRSYRIDTRSDGKSRKLEALFGAWSVVEDWH